MLCDRDEIPRCAMCGVAYDDAPEELCPKCAAEVFHDCQCEVCVEVRKKKAGEA